MCASHEIVGDHILNGLRRLADLAHNALEGSFWERIYRESALIALLDAADVTLAHIGIDLHLGKVSGDEKQCWCLEARRNGLSHCHVPRNNDAIHGRNDVGVIKIDLCAVESRLTLPNGRFVKFDLRWPGRRRSSRCRGYPAKQPWFGRVYPRG